MKTLFLVPAFILLMACEKDAADNSIPDNSNNGVEQVVIQNELLLFLYEEEKLARDVYEYLDRAWGEKQFTNIKGSEQRHMEEVAKLLDNRGIIYPRLPEGHFKDSTLQNLYNSLIALGKQSAVDALTVGATIEDMDIVDIEKMKPDFTSDSSVLTVLNNLQCGSENHLRAFNRGLTQYQADYHPQYLSAEQFAAIINSSQQPCGKGKGKSRE